MNRTPKLPPDFREFIGLLGSHGIDFLIVGAWAFGIHAEPRYTKDIDIWIRRHPETAARMVSLLNDFGFVDVNPPFTKEDFLAPNRIIQLGHEPIRIDLLTDVSGLEFDAAWKKRKELPVDGLVMNFLDFESLLQSKRASDRPQDRVDVATLEKMRARKG